MTPQTMFILFLVLTASLGCLKHSPPAAFHTLRPLVRAQEKPAPAPGSMGTLALEVMPVCLPEALQRPQLMTTSGAGTLELSDTHRWGNGLDRDMQRVLAENLTVLLGSDAVVVYPFGERVKAAYRLEVDVQRCDGRPGGVLSLRATWMVIPFSGGPALLRKRVHLDEPVTGPDLDALVNAHSRILETLSREVAEGLRQGLPR